MYFFESLLGFFDIGFTFFVWLMRYPIAEDITFGGAFIFFSLLFLLFSFVFKTRTDIANDTKLGYQPRHVYQPKHMSPVDRKRR